MSQSAKASSSLVIVEKVRTAWPSGVMTQATTDFLCTSSPQHLSIMLSILRLPGWAAGWLATGIVETLLCVLPSERGDIHAFLAVAKANCHAGSRRQ